MPRQTAVQTVVSRKHLFYDGTATQFLAVKDKIITEFIKKDCGVFIQNILPNVDDAQALDPAWEANNEHEMENRILTDAQITDRCNNERTAREAYFAAKLVTLDDLYVDKVNGDFSGTAAEKAAKCMEYNKLILNLKTPKVLEIRTEQAHLNEYTRNYEAALRTQRETAQNSHDSKVMKFDKKCAECLAIFYECIEHHLLEGVRTLLETRKFKTTWRKIDAQYSLSRVGPQAYATATAQLKKLKFAPNYDIARHIVEFRRVMTVYTALGMPHDDNAQFSMFRETFVKGGCSDYENIFNHYENVGPTAPWSIETVFTRVTDKFQELSSRRYERKLAPAHYHNVASVATAHSVSAAYGDKKEKKTCHACGKPGHIAKDCWANIVCAKCHQKGHPTDRCRADGGHVKRVNAVRVEGKHSQETLVSSFKKNRTK
jgi:hypothetical protein